MIIKHRLLVACTTLAVSFVASAALPAAADNATAHNASKMMRHQPVMMHHVRKPMMHRKMMMHHERKHRAM